MLKVAVITVFPEMIRALTDFGVTGRAVRSGLLEVRTINPRDFTADPHRTVDDRPYGGGPGMVMMVPPLRAAIREARAELPEARVIYLTPQGQRVTHREVADLAGCGSAILLAGRYEGVDERIVEADVDEEWSIGDYVLSGGELPAMVIIDAAARLLPGVLGCAASADSDSFFAGLLDHPQYTRPEEVDGQRVPAVLLGGNHEEIRRWRLKQALGRTWQRRPDLLEGRGLDDEERALLQEYISECRPGQGGRLQR
jgi:tRNA (guanine37-N1)-methyltransferase